jgi:hypothetical protein
MVCRAHCALLAGACAATSVVFSVYADEALSWTTTLPDHELCVVAACVRRVGVLW